MHDRKHSKTHYCLQTQEKKLKKRHRENTEARGLAINSLGEDFDKVQAITKTI